MEQKLVEDLEILTKDVVWLSDNFQKFKTLFGVSSERIELMNRASPSFFRTVQNAMISDIIIGIFRVAGSETTGRGDGARDNLVLKTLANEEIHGNWEGRKEYIQKLDEIKAKLEPLESLRHKTIAHRDADVARNQIVIMGPRLSEIEIAVRAIGEAIQFCQEKIRRTTFCLEMIGLAEDELFLLETIRIGLEVREVEHAEALERVRRGDYGFKKNYTDTPDWLRR